MTPTQQSIIRRMAAEKRSGTEIALAVGKSRNSIAGFCWRKKIKLLIRPATHRRGRKSHDLTLVNNEVREMIDASKPPKEPYSRSALPKIGNIVSNEPVVTKSNDGCRFLHGEARELSWCSQPVWRGNWCESHYRLTHSHVS